MTESRSELQLLCVFVATRWVSYVGFQTLPLVIGALVAGLGFSTSTAGVLGGLELIALAVTAQLSAPYVAGWGLSRTGTAGALLAAAAQLATIIVPDPVVTGLCRTATGVGTGLLAASANASLAAMTQPERWFGRIAAVGSGVAVLLLGGLPLLAITAGHRMVFVALAATLLVGAISARFLPAGRAAVRTDAARPPVLAGRDPRLLVAGVALVSFGQGAIWSFVERLATSLGIGGSHLSGWFIAGSIVGVAASAGAAQVGPRFGRTGPVLVGILAIAMACLALSRAGSELSFGVTLLAYWAATQFAFPLLFGLSALLDSSGRLVTLSSNVMLLMTSAAPMVGGFVVARAGFAPMGWLSFLSCVAATALVLPAVRATEARAGDGGSSD